MTRTLKQILALGMVASLLTSCSQSGGTTTSTTPATTPSTSQSTQTEASETKFKIIATTFAEYDWTKEVLGDSLAQFDLVQLIDTGVDLHNFEISAKDIIAIGECDLFVYTGGESTETWVDDVLEQKSNQQLMTLDLLVELGDFALVSEHFDYGDSEDSHDDHDHEEEAHDDHDHEEDAHDDHDHEEEAHDDHDHEEEAHDDHDHEEEAHDDHDHEEEAHDDHDHEEEAHDDHDHEEEAHDDHDHEEEAHDDHDHEEEAHDDHDHEEEAHDDHDHEEEAHDDHDHEEDSHDDHDHAHHDDEHIWMSLKNAKVLTAVIADALCELDPANAESYQANVAAYAEELDALDAEYKEAVDGAARNTIVVADRFPYAYLMADYGLEYHAAFSGCSAETEASFAIVDALTVKVNELDLDYVVTTETGHEIAETIVSSTERKDQEILVLDSMQSTTSSSGTSYLEIMRDNLAVLTQILN